MAEISDVLRLGRNITLFPVIHGSGDFAVEVRRLMLSHRFDCLAVPLPPSFQEAVEVAVDRLPNITAVVQRESGPWSASAFSAEDSNEEDEDWIPRTDGRCTYVPIDPCQPVIAALRIAAQERMAREFIDEETEHYVPRAAVLPDPYALKRVDPEVFAAAVLPSVAPPEDDDQWRRIQWMAAELHRLSLTHKSILFVCSLVDWPWIRDAFNSAVDRPPVQEGPDSAPAIYDVHHRTNTFLLGELPFITGLYEIARSRLDDDENLSVDGIKALLLAARDSYQQEFGNRARRITPQLLASCLKYIRNLSLIEQRFTPDLYTLIVAASQTAGDQYAIHVAEMARDYPFHPRGDLEVIRFGVDRVEMPDGYSLTPVNRLPGHPMVWRSYRLKARPDISEQVRWQQHWNPYGQCSWPPEDVAIERFRTHVKDVALDLIGNDLARTEKFSSSLKDGLDIRETLRNWHTNDLYVRIFPPAKGRIDCVVMLFDSPADPRDYPWRITWHAEHHDESTLSLFATDFGSNLVGPGIALARYGGCMFLFPPRPIMDIWRDPRFDFADTLEERLLAAGLCYSREKHIALMSHKPPGAGWRRLAARFRKKIVHVPLSRFGTETVERLRMFHVLNGHQVRSYAAHFIRKP
ncbi:MAG: hypothetical protein KDA96_02660 [Planctomycetaceae bacterium]|nr:hypothetical protein [Planctomycetaceae bacterium]